MKRFLLSALLGLCASGIACSRPQGFKPPVRLRVGNTPIRAESPGYAAPGWADINGDGKMHLLVGQFAGGKIQVFPHVGGENFAVGTWLQAAGEVAEVPGVW